MDLFTTQNQLKPSSHKAFRPASSPLLKARWVHDGVKLSLPGFPSLSLPPSFFPLNCNLLSLLPLHLTVLFMDETFNITQCVKLHAFTGVSVERKLTMICAGQSLHSVCPPCSPNEETRWGKMMGRDVYRVDVCLEKALASELMMNSAGRLLKDRPCASFLQQ